MGETHKAVILLHHIDGRQMEKWKTVCKVRFFWHEKDFLLHQIVIAGEKWRNPENLKCQKIEKQYCSQILFVFFFFKKKLRIGIWNYVSRPNFVHKFITYKFAFDSSFTFRPSQLLLVKPINGNNVKVRVNFLIYICI